MLQTLLTFLILILFASSVGAGSIQGKIAYKGPLTPPKVIKTGKYKKVCGPKFVDQSLLVNDHGVQNVVVWLSGKNAKKLKGDPGTYQLNQNHCQYEPHVIPMMKGSELEILTSDPINHNIHTFSFDNDPINIMFTPGQDHVQEFYEPEPIKVECDLHDWMKAWIFVTPNPYFALSQNGGNYIIKDVPPGKYTLNFWHETLGEISRKVVVQDGNLKVDLKFPATSSVSQIQ